MDRVKEVMIKELVCCTPLTKVEDSQSLMEKYHCTKIPVVNTIQDKRIVGMISKSDLLSGADKVIQYMSKDSKVVDEDSTVDECLRIMIVNNVDQVPVIDKQGHFCGIVTEKVLIERH